MTKTLEGVVDQLLDQLTQRALLPYSPKATPWSEFAKWSRSVHKNFEVPATSFTPAMRRLLFGIGFRLGDARILGAGTYVGYTVAWLMLGSWCSTRRLERSVCVDVDHESVRVATANYQAVPFGHAVEFVTADVNDYLTSSRQHESFDCVFVDMDDPKLGKAGYADLFQKVSPMISLRGLILAHDPLVAKFEADIRRFHGAIESSGNFDGPHVIPIDHCGLTIACRQK